jgi:hypothetical protein
LPLNLIQRASRVLLSLPEDLKGLAFRQAAVIDAGVDFRSHVERLIKSMDRMLSPSADASVNSISNAKPKHVVPPQQSTIDQKPKARAADAKPPSQDDSKPKLQSPVATLESASNITDQKIKTETRVESGSSLQKRAVTVLLIIGLAGLFLIFALSYFNSERHSATNGFETPWAVRNVVLTGHWCSTDPPSDFWINLAPQTGDLTFTGPDKRTVPITRQAEFLVVGQNTTYTITTSGTLQRNGATYIRCQG